MPFKDSVLTILVVLTTCVLPVVTIFVITIPRIPFVPCKIYNYSKLDCGSRDLIDIPQIPTVNLTSIELGGNNLTVVTSRAFIDHVELLVLKLDGNQISAIQENAFDGLRNLRTLDLFGNRLSYLNDTVFCNLVNLEYLDLTYNELTYFPNEALAPLKSLITLNLTYNLLTSIETNVSASNLINLHEIQLIGRDNIAFEITNSSFQFFANISLLTLNLGHYTEPIIIQSDAFQTLQHLKTLTLSCSGPNSIEYLPVQIENLQLQCDNASYAVVPDRIITKRTLAPLRELLSLYTLRLQLSFQSIQNNAFIWVPSLKTLDLSWNFLKTIPGAAFVGLVNLRELDLSYNALREIPTNALLNLGSLTMLYLSNNRISGTPKNITKPFGVLSLEEIRLDNNGITDIGENLFNSLSALKQLHLENNLLTDSVQVSNDLVNLEELDISGNKFQIFPLPDWKMPLTSLKSLTISNFDTIKWFPDVELSKLYPALTELFISDITCGFPLPSTLFHNLPHLGYLDASYNCITNTILGIILNSNISSLVSLQLTQNSISSLEDEVFQLTPLMEELDVSFNVISAIAKNTFQPLTQLRFLNLNGNKLVDLSSLAPPLYTTLKNVYISGNSIARLPEFVLSNASALQELDASGNPFTCDCSIKLFQDWMDADMTVHLRYFVASKSLYDIFGENYLCSNPNITQTLVVFQINLNCSRDLVKKDVVSQIPIYKYVVPTTLVGILLAGTLVLAYKNRWKIKLQIFLAFQRRKYKHPLDETDLVDNAQSSQKHHFDAFVSYNEADEDWVLNHLLVNMEQSGEPVRLFFPPRDMPAGDSILDCIVEGIELSKKTILVLSPNFMDSEWNYFEMLMAHMRLFMEGRDVLVLMILREIPDSKMTLLLRKLLCKKEVLNWPLDDAGQQLFWHKLKVELKRPVYVDRRIDI